MAALAASMLLQLLLLLQDLGRTIVYSAVLPLPRLELTTGPLALANHRKDLFHQAQPGQCGSIQHPSADANPQFK